MRINGSVSWLVNDFDESSLLGIKGNIKGGTRKRVEDHLQKYLCMKLKKDRKSKSKLLIGFSLLK